MRRGRSPLLAFLVYFHAVFQLAAYSATMLKPVAISTLEEGCNARSQLRLNRTQN